MDPGTWNQGNLNFGYRWQRCDSAGANCQDIQYAQSNYYGTSGADDGDTIRVVIKVTSSVTWSTTTVTTAAVGPVVDPNVVQNLTLPSISGDTVVGSTLTADPGTWRGVTDHWTYFDYGWERCNAAGENCKYEPQGAWPSYVVTAADLGSTIRVGLNVQNELTGGYASVASDPTAAIGPAKRP